MSGEGDGTKPDPADESERPDGVSDLEPIDIGEETNVAEDLDEMLYGN